MLISSFTAFFISLLTLYLCPSLHLFYFGPTLVFFCYRHSKFGALWRSVLCGVCIDLFSAEPLFGVTSLTYCLTTWLLYGQHRNFFEDKLLTLPLMTAFFAIVSTLIQVCLYFGFSYSIALSPAWALTDLCVMPLIDGLYALIFFSLPFQITRRLVKMRFLIRKKR